MQLMICHNSQVIFHTTFRILRRQDDKFFFFFDKPVYYLPATVGPRLLWARRRARRRRSHHPAQDALRRIRCSSPTGAHPACRCKSSGLRPRKWGKEREGGRGGLIWGPASRRAGSGCRIASARGRRPPTTAPRWRRRAGSRRSSAPRACSPWRPEQAAPPLAERLGRLASSFELAGRWYY